MGGRNDGVERDVDCAFLLRRSLGEPLRDPEYFRQVRSMTRHERWCGPTALIPRRSFCTATASRWCPRAPKHL